MNLPLLQCELGAGMQLDEVNDAVRLAGALERYFQFLGYNFGLNCDSFGVDLAPSKGIGWDMSPPLRKKSVG